MSKNSIYGLVSQFLGQQNNISVPVPLVRIVGDYAAAAFVSQCVYWADRTSDPEGWFHKTHDQWLEELILSSDQVRRCVKSSDGLVEVKRAGIPARNYYRVNRDLLIERLQGLAEEEIVTTARNGETQYQGVGKPNGSGLGLSTASTTADPTSSTKTTTKTTTKTKTPSTADAAGGEAETGNPVTEVPEPQQPEPASSSQVQETVKASAEPSQATDLEKVPGAAAGAARPLTEHQAMMDAIRATLYPQSERCADSIERRMAAASKELRSAGLGPDAPAGIHAFIRTEQSWRRAVTPETLVQVSADWANARAPRPAPAPTPTPDAQPKKGGFLR